MYTPDLAAFLSAPEHEVAAVAPSTVVYTPGGTRRAAALAGIKPGSDHYATWSRQQAIARFDLFFRMGVKHLFTNALAPSQLAEVGPYRDRVIAWTIDGLIGSEALQDYARHGWRVRIFGGDQIPELRTADEQLRAAAPAHWRHTLWWCVTAEPGGYWSALLAAAQQAQARTRDEAILALYGEAVPPATLWLGFGKPSFSADMLPLLLADALQCYWDQRPGYSLDEPTLRHILYDYAYQRQTWSADKTNRYIDIPGQRDLWNNPLVVGLGRRLGRFWYPLYTQEPEGDDE
jgi:hypothetical protein